MSLGDHGDFQKLQAFWYKKLAKSGFKDAEKVSNKVFVDLRNDSKYFQRNISSTTIQDKFNYFSEAGRFYWSHSFKTPLDKNIWKLHSEGLSRREVGKKLKEEGYQLSDSLLQLHIQRLRKIMMTAPEEKIKKSDLFKRRDFVEEDKKFVLSSWVKGYHHGNQVIKKINGEKERFYGNAWFREINEPLFYKNYYAVISRLLERPEIMIPVICLVAEPSVILGYAVVEKQTLHWVYVKEMWRGIGLMKDLLKNLPLTECSHLTSLGQLIKPKHILFNPFF